MRRTAMFGITLLLAFPRAASAFSEPLLYAEPTLAGGGGGRFFTGSPLDAYSCAVCHEGGSAPSVTLRGFPESYVPGKRYDVELSWSDARKVHALNLEIVDTKGRAAGTLALPSDADVDEDGRCSLNEDEALRDQIAASLATFNDRKIISVLGCGARSLRFQFEAPEDEETIALTASVVRADGEQDREGDGVLEIRRIARVRPDAAKGGLLPLRGGDGLLGLGVGVLAWLAARRRAR